MCWNTLLSRSHRHRFGPERDAEGRWNWLSAADREMRGFLSDFERQTQEISRVFINVVVLRNRYSKLHEASHA